MYPLIRFIKEMWRAKQAEKLGVFDAHISHHICWPWDLDPWIELNNGRTLTLFDLGRMPMGLRTGLAEVMRDKKWGITVAGNSVRYRRRVRGFDRFTMVSRCIGWDHRFLYMEQSMWRKGECCNHMLLRAALTSPEGIVAPILLSRALGGPEESPPLPEWVQAWIAADHQRPWPPELPADAAQAVGRRG